MLATHIRSHEQYNERIKGNETISLCGRSNQDVHNAAWLFATMSNKADCKKCLKKVASFQANSR